MKKIRRKLWLLLVVAAALVLLTALVLPFFVDVNRFRGLIEAKVEEALGRDVRLGEIRLAILPAIGLRLQDVAIGALPEEGGGDLITATSLRIGARLIPLLSKRLEMTSIVLEEPRMVLSRDRDGSWNVERLVAKASSSEDASTDGSPADSNDLSIASLRLTGGRLTIQDASVPERPLEVVLTDLDVELDDFRLGSTSSFALETSFESAPGSRLKLSGEGGPVAADAAGDFNRLVASLELESVTGPLLADLARLAGLSLEGALGDRAFDASGRFDAELGSRSRIMLSDLEIKGVDLVLSRARDGSWNVERIGGGQQSSAEEGGSEISIDALRLTDGRLTVRDGSASGQPLEVALTDLSLELQDFRPESTSSFALETGFELAPGARLEISGGGALAGEGVTTADIKLERMGGEVLARLASFAGISIENALGEGAIDASARLDADLGPAGPITVSDLTLTGAEVDLRRSRDGRWNFELGEGSQESSPARPLMVRGVTIDGTRIHIRDDSAGTEPFDIVLDGFRLELDQLPSTGPAAVRATSTVEGEGGRGSLEVSGSLGPLGPGSEPTPMELAVNLQQLPLAVVRPLLEIVAGAGSEAGKADLDLRLKGRFPAAYTAVGSLDLTSAKFDTGEQILDLDLGVHFDVAARRGVDALEFKTLDLELKGTGASQPASSGTLALRGSVEQVDGGRRWDMTLDPTRLPAADLSALLELLVADFSMSLASEVPLAIEARVQGLETADGLPDFKGRVELRGFSLRHPSLAKPIEKVDADVAFEGEAVWVTGLAATIGDSELAGDLTLTGWQRPSVTFNLRSPRADIGEILSAFESTATETVSAGASPESNLLEHIVADGDLSVASGSWDTLEFADLSTRVQLESGIMTLDPVDLRLYGGAFDGRVVADLNVTPAAFEIQGNATDVDVDPFLAANLEVSDALFGRFTGEIRAGGAGDDYDSIVGSLAGEGSARLDDGRLGRLDLLSTVARVSGVLGQRSLASLADRIAKESTRFERLEGKFQLAAGNLTVTELILDSPDFGLEGQAELNLLAANVGGRFQLTFSELLSDSMQREASRAGELFWNPDRQRVIMPLALAGSVESPVATVDWSRAVKRYATGQLTRKLTGLLAEALGGGEKEDEETASGTPPLNTEPEPWIEDRLEVEITRVRWGGSILLQDLKLEGTVRGREIERATLVAVDADGTEIERFGRLGAVDAYLSSGADPAVETEIRWEARIEGKDLVLAAFPLTVTVTVYSQSGERAKSSVTVEK